MRRYLFTFAGLLLFFSWSCKQEISHDRISFVSPEIGSNIRSGEQVMVKLHFADKQVDSVIYYIDSTVVARKTDTTSVRVSTEGLPLGNRLFTARVFQGGITDDITSNIVLLAASGPEQMSFEVIKTFPHDTSSYTQGLEFHDGIFYESDGQYGESSLRKVEVATGEVIQKVDLPANIFAEGITVIDDKIVQITYHENVFIVYDKNTLEKIAEHPYPPGREGWGLAFDGEQILNSDGTNVIHFLNKETFREERYIEVYNNSGPVYQLNELEFIDGKIYANVYTTNQILIIDPATGAVTGEIDLSGLYPEFDADSDLVLNGIAYDKTGDRLFVTGKKWDKLFQIKVVRK